MEWSVRKRKDEGRRREGGSGSCRGPRRAPLLTRHSQAVAALLCSFPRAVGPLLPSHLWSILVLVTLAYLV